MSEPQRNAGEKEVSAVDSDGNPQGKGMVPVLDALNALRPWQPGEKEAEQILREFCLSTLVLSARFDFRVVPDKTYFLYRSEAEWCLSLISPEEWGARIPGAFLGSCCLAQDMTWSLELAPDVANDPALVAALQTHLQGFVSRLEEVGTLEDALPLYESTLPYQQRMMATALSSSLQTSLLVSGLRGRAGTQWLQGNAVSQLLLG